MYFRCSLFILFNWGNKHGVQKWKGKKNIYNYNHMILWYMSLNLYLTVFFRTNKAKTKGYYLNKKISIYSKIIPDVGKAVCLIALFGSYLSRVLTGKVNSFWWSMCLTHLIFTKMNFQKDVLNTWNMRKRNTYSKLIISKWT